MSFLFNRKVRVDNPLSQFNEVKTVERTPIIEIIPLNGLTELRDANTVTGSGTIGRSSNSEIFLSTGTTANSTVTLETTEKGRYMSGFGGECGEGFRFAPSANSFAGTAYAEWGYGSNTDGFVFGRDSSNTYIRLYSEDEQVAKIHRDEWNIDRLDGTGPSTKVWDPKDGDIYQINFTWYGYGDIEFNIVTTDPVTNRQEIFPVHNYDPAGSASVSIPNLPIRAFITNGDQATDYVTYVGGRQFTVVGPFIPSVRPIGETVFKGTDTTFRPFVTFRSKTDKASKSTSKKVSGFSVTPVTEDVYVQVRVGGNVSNTADFRVPTDHSNNEVTSIVDTTANTITGGVVIYKDHVSVSAGGGSNASGEESLTGLAIDIPDNKNCSILLRTRTGTGEAIVTFRWKEEF